ncbi:MAG TPA: hypothetical protein VHB21_19505 [Minicystis sp.]|nr:hypothetical protein [Minicystis sp.]
MGERVSLVLAFFVCALTLSSAFATAALLIARAARLGVVKVGVGAGPRVVRAGVVELRLLPWGSFIEPARGGDLPNVPPASALADAIANGRLRLADDAPAAVLVALAALPFVLASLASLALLGPGAPGAASGGISAIVAGALSPLTAAPRALDAALACFRAGDLPAFVGGACAAIAGLEAALLPSNVLFVLWVKTQRSGFGSARLVIYLALLAAMVCWLVGLVAWLARA